MLDRFQTGPPGDPRPPLVPRQHPGLPAYLARRLLRPGEEVAWVRGPRLNPWWEPYVTRPAMFLVALAIGAACLTAGRLAAGSWADLHPLPAAAAAVVVIGSVFVLAFFSGYFTRLVVTDARLFIVQGYEVCRTWGMDDLPRRLLHYRRLGGEEGRAIDLDAVRSLFGDVTQPFSDSKTIRAFGKQLDQITAREHYRPDPRRPQPGG